MSLASRIDGILAGHSTPTTVESVTAYATCPACAGPLHVDRITGGRQTRRVHVTCTTCNGHWVLTVGIARPTSAARLAPANGPRLPWAPLARHLPAKPDAAAEILDVDVRSIYRWRHHGIPADWADQLAVTAGVLPVEVWGQSYYLVTGIEGAA